MLIVIMETERVNQKEWGEMFGLHFSHEMYVDLTEDLLRSHLSDRIKLLKTQVERNLADDIGVDDSLVKGITG